MKCERCRGEGVVGKWEDTGVKVAWTLGGSVVKKFYYKCEECDGTGEKISGDKAA